jgi:sugar transferase (PEP-CTERM/EpsH1 system associated)
MKILFISRWFPYPPDNGSKIRVFNLIKGLASRHEVDLASFTFQAVTEQRMAAMREYCQRVAAVVYKPFEPNRLKALVGLFSPRPRSVVDTHSMEMQRVVEQMVVGRPFDVIVASEIDMTPYAAALPRVPKILEDVELTMLYERFAEERRPLKRLRSGLTWWKLSRYVADLLPAFDGCTVVSDRERERILQVSPDYGPIGVVPNGVDVVHYAGDFGAPDIDTLVYPGALTYSANLDAMEYFLGEVFPLIRAERPDARISITGRTDGVALDRLPRDDGVVLTGYLDDVRPTVARSWACVVPLRVGGGTRLKILEALALGTPVVASSKGAEGLDLIAGRDLLIADEPAGFAAAVLRLLHEPALREALSRNGRRAVEAAYDWPIIGQRFNDFIGMVVAQDG